ncbi:MAG: galactokinase [Bacteroidota bacterium]
MSSPVLGSLNRKASGAVIVHAPGRINLIGDHTDYQDGFVLPAAVEHVLEVHLQKNGSPNLVNLKASDLGETYSFELTDYSATDKGWPNYIMGVIYELQKLGATIQGFDAHFTSAIPMGAGMSSSAALECGFALALNALYDLDLDHESLIQASQRAEHHFVGTKCGIMDQFASMMGKKDQVMRLDCRNLDFDYFPCALGDYQLLLLNSNVTHSLASSAYNTRREESEEGVRYLQKEFPRIKNLRDIPLDQLLQVKEKLPERLFRRCHHVVSENQRVLMATHALLNQDFVTLGRLMYQSHRSLQEDYEVSCPELDFLVEQTRKHADILGSRMMGGGFGGCTINLIAKDRVEDLVHEIRKNYQNQFGMELSPIAVTIGNGAQVIDKS